MIHVINITKTGLQMAVLVGVVSKRNLKEKQPAPTSLPYLVKSNRDPEILAIVFGNRFLSIMSEFKHFSSTFFDFVLFKHFSSALKTHFSI